MPVKVGLYILRLEDRSQNVSLKRYEMEENLILLK